MVAYIVDCICFYISMGFFYVLAIKYAFKNSRHTGVGSVHVDRVNWWLCFIAKNNTRPLKYKSVYNLHHMQSFCDF